MNETCTELFKTHYRRLYTLAFRITGNPQDSEDVLQNAFLEVHRALPGFRNESSAYTWLYRIVRNCAGRYNRKTRRLPVDVMAEERGVPKEDIFAGINRFGLVEEQVLTDLTRETCLQMFMNCMPRRYRTVYALRCILGFSVAETAEIMEISPEAVKVYLHRSRRISRDHFEGRCSLIHPGAPCDCRAFAAYLKASGKTGLLLNLEAAAAAERAAAETFHREVAEVREIQRLYETRILPEPFPAFLEKIRTLMKQESFRLLDA